MATGQVSPKVGKVIDIPANAPTIGTATAGVNSATVTYTAGSTTTGGPVFYHTAISNPGSITGTSTTSPITVSGLTADTSYTFTIAGTNPSGSSAYSSASNSITALGTAFESIATATGTGSSGTITFNSIPATYKHLQIRCIGRSTTTKGYGIVKPNNDSSTANYTYHTVYGGGATVTADKYTTGSLGGSYSIYTTGATSELSDNVGATILDIHDYASTTKYKTFRSFTGYDNNQAGNGIVFLISTLWLSTSAISSLTIDLQGVNFSTATTLALYGIKG